MIFIGKFDPRPVLHVFASGSFSKMRGEARKTLQVMGFRLKWPDPLREPLTLRGRGWNRRWRIERGICRRTTHERRPALKVQLRALPVAPGAHIAAEPRRRAWP